MKKIVALLYIQFICSFSFVFTSDLGPTIAQLPDMHHVAIMPDGSVSILQPEQPYQPQVFQGTPLRLDEVMALHTGRERFKRYGGGYHRPIAHWQEEYKTHLARNPRINPDADYQAQNILSNLKHAVLYCNQKYPKVSSSRA